jgi:hypothetical protein
VIGRRVGFLLLRRALADRLGVSRQYGFLRFGTIRESTKFLDEHYPTIYLRSCPVSVAFSREKGERDRVHEMEWTCSNVCFHVRSWHR